MSNCPSLVRRELNDWVASPRDTMETRNTMKNWDLVQTRASIDPKFLTCKQRTRAGRSVNMPVLGERVGFLPMEREPRDRVVGLQCCRTPRG